MSLRSEDTVKKMSLPAVITLLIILQIPVRAGSVIIEEDLFLHTEIIQKAYDFLNTPYLYGGAERTGMDCSGFVYRVFNEAAGITLPRQVNSLYNYGDEVEGNLLPGDLIFFDTMGSGPSHVGIYIGSRRFIHAASEGRETGVIISSLEENYYKKRILSARRPFHIRVPEIEFQVGGGVKKNKLEYPLLPGYPVKLVIQSEYAETQFMTLKFFKEGNVLFSRLIKVRPGYNNTLVWFTPQKGSWMIYIEDRYHVIGGLVTFEAGRDR